MEYRRPLSSPAVRAEESADAEEAELDGGIRVWPSEAGSIRKLGEVREELQKITTSFYFKQYAELECIITFFSIVLVVAFVFSLSPLSHLTASWAAARLYSGHPNQLHSH